MRMKREIVESDLQDIYSRDIPWELLENKTVLITGAYGMLASYCVFLLMYLNEKKGMHIRVIALVRSLEKFEKRFGSVVGKPYLKVCTDALDETLQMEEEIDYIIHAASLASPQYYSVCPVDVLKPNVIGSYHLLELAARKKVKGFLLFSSGDIYGAVSGVKRIGEDNYGSMDTLDIHNCYSESKRMAETMCKAYYCQKGVPVKIARIWHTYAPTMDIDTDPRVFASFVKDVVYGHDIVMRSNGSAKRSFLYIADAVAAYFLLLLRGKAGEAYNVCNTDAFCSIAQLAEKLVSLYPDKNLQVVHKEREKTDSYVENREANDIPPDNSKLKALGWQVKYDIETGFCRVTEALEAEGA